MCIRDRRRAYREALVQKVAAKMEDEKEASMDKTCEKCGEKYAGKGCEACGYAANKSDMKEAKAFSSAARQAFAAKAIAEGFPIEYVNARLGETSAPAVDKLSDIKNVLASGLETNVKVAAASSMIKVATLSDADYSRIIDYWKNELGYGDQEWIDALFTKKYDK
jgi:predicted  nucleic acid-binding Zn-ribbon protein